jgi:hypothetical protein
MRSWSQANLGEGEAETAYSLLAAGFGQLAPRKYRDVFSGF